MKALCASVTVILVAVVPIGLSPVTLPAWIERIGWTLVHSMWELAAVAVVVAITDALVRRRTARTRYAISTIGLGLMLLLPGVTWLCVAVNPPVNSAVNRPIAVKTRTEIASTAVDGTEPEITSIVVGALNTDPQNIHESDSPLFRPVPEFVDREVPHETMPPVSVEFQPSVTTKVVDHERSPEPPGRPGNSLSLMARLQAAVESKLPWLVGIWLIGVALCSLRLLCGIGTQWRLQSIGLSPVSESIMQTLEDLAKKMRISKAVRIAQSKLVTVPLVVGYLRPLILLPVSVVTGLTPAQLEAVLAHELAHVRRHDWLINTLQVLAETTLFYHPAVWWVSSRLRRERELCCDDLALGIIRDKAVFARTLLLLEEIRQSTTTRRLTTTALAATGGQLSDRIRRLLPASSVPEQTSRSWLTGMVLLLTLAIAGGVTLLAQTKRALEEQENSSPDKSNQPAESDGLSVPRNRAGGKKPSDKDTGFDDSDQPKRIVSVVDEDEKPVVGATVRFQFDITPSNSTIFDGPVETNAQGKAQIAIPELADRVWITVTAKGFGESSVEESASGQSTIVLHRGRVIRVRAVDVKGQVLKDAVPLLADTHSWGREFKLTNDGIYESPGVSLKRKVMRVAVAQENGPMLFSELIDVSTAKPADDGVLQVVVQPGVRLEGRLDDSVPRPITEGYVDLCIVEGEHHKWSSDGVEWNDFAPVRPDGTFTFESLPGGGHAQLHVVVDGYVSTNPTPDELIGYMRQYELVNEKRMDEYKENSIEFGGLWCRMVPLDQRNVTVQIPCEPTASCDFRLLDPSGRPVPDATVNFNPNVAFIGGGLSIPSTGESQALLVDGLRRGHAGWHGSGGDGEDTSPHGLENKKRYDWAKRWFLHATSDADGRVRIRNLPGSPRASFFVAAEGLVLPISPLLDEEQLARRHGENDRDRFGVVELVSGQTIEKTIYLERAQSLVDRELIVVDRKGNPIAGVGISVAEIRVGASDWQTWSIQRFGPLPRGTTDEFGRLTLQLPSAIEKVDVERIKLGVNYMNQDRGPRAVDIDAADKLFISQHVVEIPLAPDDGVIILLPNPIMKNTEVRTFNGIAKYGRLEDLLPNAGPAEWLAALIKQPNVAVLRKLLSATKKKYPEPVELIGENEHIPRAAAEPGESGADARLIRVVSDGVDRFAIVEARVQPVTGLLARRSSPRSPRDELPECAFVFDMQGNLLAALGGVLGTTGSNSPDDVELVNLGPKEDWFICVNRWEKKGDFEQLSTYYRLAKPIVNSLQFFHVAGNGGNMAFPDNVCRSGSMSLEVSTPLNSPEPGNKSLGITADGVAMVPQLIWDADRNRFVGPVSLRTSKQKLYEVDAAWSQDFESFVPKPDQMIVVGHEYESYWYYWSMAVPKDFEALVTLSLPQRNGQPKVIERSLASGRQMIRFQFIPTEDKKGMTGKLRLGIDTDFSDNDLEKIIVDLPDLVGDHAKNSVPIMQTINPNETARVLNQSLKTPTDRVTIDLKLKPL